FGVTAAAQQQFAERGEGWRPVRIEFDGVSQDPLRSHRVAQHQRGAAEQPLRLGIVGMRFNDVPKLRVSRAKIAGLQQAVDALHRSVERNRNHVSRRTVRRVPVKCSRRPALSPRATVYASFTYCGLRCSRGLPLASRSTVMSKCLPRNVTFVSVSDFHLDGNTGGYAWTRPDGSMRSPVSPYTRLCTNPAEPVRK